MPSRVGSEPAEQTGNTCKPPWGLQTPKREDRRDAAFMSTYNRMFQGWKGTPARPIRQRTAPHMNEGLWNDRSNYKETFRTPHVYSRYSFVPASVNRHDRPHPSQLIWPLEPNKQYMIWKPQADLEPPRHIASAPISLLQFNKQRSMNTTYNDFFKGQKYFGWQQNIPRPSKTEERQRPSTEDRKSTASQRPISQRPVSQRPISQRPVSLGDRIDKTVYQHNFQGEFGRPSTIDKPPDRSWANIRY